MALVLTLVDKTFFGLEQVLGFALLCNLLRFLFIACIQEAWHILPFECLQGITHAAVWATLCSLLEDAAPNESPEAAQAWLHAAYAAIGKGSGSLLGGLFIGWLGTRAVFGLYALASLVVLLMLLAVCTRLKQSDATTAHANGFQRTVNGQPMVGPGKTLAGGILVSEQADSIRINPCPVPTGPAFCGVVGFNYPNFE